MSALDKFKTHPRAWTSAALISVGLASGAVLGTTITAGASTTTSAATTSTSGSSTSTGSSPTAPPYGHPGCAHALGKSGTVTAVGAHSVTISGTTYAVTSSSDIDKNGEATLSSLAVGDRVTFSTVSGASTPTIDKLHAGNESLDMPSGPPQGTPPGGAAPTSGTAVG